MSDKGNNSITDVLRSFPINYVVHEVELQGQSEEVTNFLGFDDVTGLVLFKNGSETKVFDSSRITGLLLDEDPNGENEDN
ncbi:hypothetical protein [Salsuginibacillus kocurii]|uniref:hypothetical protein n=1 Tax=Salsuginibacillus kocurii TaxID=427078 RepID=UPI00037F7B64|nr:hypothetical protein [Salsuginibacillus kocurii]